MIEKKIELKALNLGFLGSPCSLLASYFALVLTGNLMNITLRYPENKKTVFSGAKMTLRQAF